MPTASKPSKYAVLDEIEVPANVLANWQTTADLLAELAGIPAALIMRVHAHEIEVFVASHSPGNVYHPGEKAPLDSGLYCETVMSSQRPLLVPNALEDPAWDHNPDITLGMISYCGLPLTWPTGELFGTLCVLDRQTNAFNHRVQPLMERLRDSIQLSLANIFETSLARLQKEEAQEALHQSEDRFRHLVELAPIPLAHVTRGGVIEHFNESFAHVFGYSPEDLPTIEAWWLCACPDPAYRAWAKETWERAVADAAAAGRNIRPVEYQITCKNGDVRIMEISGVTLGDDVLVIFIDLTERKQAEQRLALQARRATALLELPSLAETLDEAAFLQHALALTEDLTGSRISFAHLISADERTIELVAWSKRTLAHYCTAVSATHYPVTEAGIWADALRLRQPVVVNYYAAYEHKRGLPAGHAEVSRLISVPVIESGKVVAIMGVGNKAAEYEPIDVETVQLVANLLWRLVQRRRSELELELERHRHPQDALIESAPAELHSAVESPKPTPSDAAIEHDAGYDQDPHKSPVVRAERLDVPAIVTTPGSDKPHAT